VTERDTDQISSKGLSKVKQALLQKRLRGDLDRLDRVGAIPLGEHTGPIPLSYAQERMWFLSQLDPSSPAYNVDNVFRLQGRRDTTALNKSFGAIIQRHESLRTRFVAENGRPYQQVVPVSDFQLSVTDLRSLSQREETESIHDLIRAEIRRPFDLATGPLLRALLLKRADDDHILALTIHHIVFDEWSSELFWREMSTFYRAFTGGQRPRVPDLPLQYADFARWQRQQVGEQMETQLTFWKQQLGVALSPLQLPADHPRPPQQGFSGAMAWLNIPDALYVRLKALDRAFGTTTFMTLLAAFQLLLHRYTGQTNTLVGIPIANRSRSETQDLIGLFLNTLVMRADFDDDPRVDELIAQVRKTAQDGYAHQDLPFEKLVDALRLQRDVSHNPIFQVMFVHQKTDYAQIDLPDLTASLIPVDMGVAKFDLTLFVQESDSGLNAGIEYNTDLFNPDSAEQMLGHFRTVLESVVENPRRRVSEVELLTASEREVLLYGWNDTETTPFPNACIHQLIEQQVKKKADVVAVADDSLVITYRELDRRANQLAHYLQRLGVRANTPVGLLLERSTEMIVAILGVLKAGGAYLPLDPAYPQERLAFMLADTGAPVVLTQKKWADALQEREARTVVIDAEWDTIAQEDVAAPNTPVLPENLAYVIYTSGSTGVPKGVPVSHQRLVYSTVARYHFYERAVDRFLMLSSFTFDSSVAGIFWTLCQGGVLVLPPQRIEQDTQQLAATIAVHQISHILMLPSLYAILLEQADTAQLASLQTVIVAGEECRRGLVDRHYTQLPQAALVNEYGPTEGTVWSTAFKVPADFEGDRVPIGRPIPNMQNYILDSHNHLAPIGVPGELCIGGVGVTSGYLNRPELTTEKFIEHSFAGEPPIRLYRTGDLARYLPDGNIEFLGRVDHQVKIRGYRIEIGEIEAVLGGHPVVRQVVIVAHESDDATDTTPKRLVAYVEPIDGQKVSASELRRFLLDRLPDYMVPSTFVTLDALPLTPNGKVDRSKLPAPDTDLILAADTAFVAPRTPVEEILAEIWATVLRVKRLGIHDNFFELGGDSILSIQIIARAAQQNIKLKPNDIFRYPTVAALAGVATVGNLEIEAQQTAITGPVQLTPIQHWFFEQPLKAPHHWNQSYLLELSPNADLALIERSLQRVCFHHDALRLRFVRTGGSWTQENAEPEQSMRILRIDLSDLSEKEQQQALAAEVDKLQQGLDLTRGGLVQAGIFELGPGQSARLLLVIHHLAVDGVSWQILLEDLETVYQQLRDEQPVQLPAKTTSFQQWADRLSKFSQSTELARDLDYWLAIDSAIDIPLSPDIQGGTAQNTVGSMETVSVALAPDETKTLLQQVPSTYQTQINDALLTALLLTFIEQTGTNTLHFDLEGHGREALFEEIDLSRTVGWFTTVFPLRLSLPAGASVGEALIAVKEQLRRVPHKGLSYGLLRYLSKDQGLREQVVQRPQPEITFNYLGQFDQGLSGFSLFKAAPEPVGLEHNPDDPRRYLLEINSMVQTGQLIVKWSYSTNCFRPETIENLAGSFIRNLRSIIEHCTVVGAGSYTPSDFPLVQLSQSELSQLTLDVAQNSLAIGLSRIAKNIEAIYPLSPMQQLMLLHTLSQPAGDVLFTQMRYTLTGVINTTELHASWQQIVTRHPALRTAFVWEYGDSPIQVVWQQARLDFVQREIRHLGPAEQQAELAAILDADRIQGFKLAQPPLMRLTLVHLADGLAELVWSSHHLVMDRWCVAIILRELLLHYDNALRGRVKVQLERTRPFADYVDWLQQQNEQEAESFWRERLAGFTRPTLLVGPATPNPSNEQQTLKASVLPPTTGVLQAIARQRQLTMNTLTQGTWALLLSRYCQVDDVVFGATVSGRPADIAGVESMVGSFINNLPVRVKLDRGKSVIEWLENLQAQQIAMQPYEYISLSKIHSWSEISNQDLLFDTLLVFQAPITVQGNFTETINVSVVGGDMSTVYPFALSVLEDGDELRLWATFDATQIGEPVVEQLLNQLTRLFGKVADHIDRSVGEMLDATDIEPLLSQPLRPRGDARRLPAATQSTPAVAFRTDAEHRMIGMWESILGISPIGVHDNFFELGGTSLQAVQLVSQLEKMARQKLSVATLFQAPTIERMSQVLQQGGWDGVSSSLVAIQAEGLKPPLYFIPGNFGNVFTDLGYIARYLGSDQPFYGLQDTTDMPSRIPAMAERYLAQIRAFQPEGPYLLGGVCSGGLVAYEMAQQLLRQGHHVTLLALVEIFAKEPNVQNLLTSMTVILHKLFRFLGYFSNHDGEGERPITRALGRRELGAYLRFKGKVVANILGATIYSPKPYPGRVDVFLTEESLAIYEPRVSWSRYASDGAEMHKLPGTHARIVGANAEISKASMKVLAQQLEARIDIVLANPQPLVHIDETITTPE
jgi:amino acid adenylation domain-containing protein/non-ribosomal peptide synthase protein (TIGR01720 family)